MKMKCPYNRKSEIHAQAWFQIPNADGIVIRGVTMNQWDYEQADCPKEQCGAWHDGKCCYNEKQQ